MMLMRVELYCHGWPEGNISHGHVEVKVNRFPITLSRLDHEVQRAKEVLLSKISRTCQCGEYGEESASYASVDIISLMKPDDFEGEVYAEVVAGEGEALAQNPIGKQFHEF